MMNINSPEKLKAKPDCVLFDLDNTLYSYDPSHEAGLSAVKAKVTKNFNLTGQTFDEAFNKAKVLTKAQLESTAASHSRLLYMQKMLELLGLGSQVLFALDLEQTYWRAFLANANLFPNAKEFLDDLRLNSIPTAIVTDLTAQIQFRKMIYFGLDHYFDCIVTSEEVGQEKPHAAPFKSAIEKLQPKGSTIWMIGDNPKNDIGGARTAINAVTFQKIHAGVELGKNENTPDYSFENFSELRTLLQKIE
ncbi:MAG: HAD family hydrolase [Polynucleobacter sp.]|nr:HAD family hydrolase [Polynucleobacter sp.]